MAATFPKAGGDIAADDATGWNGTKPGSTEEAKFDQAGTYTASDDVTFGYVNFATDGLVFDFTADKKTVTIAGATVGSDYTTVRGPTAKNATTQLKGGSWIGKDMKFCNKGTGIGSGYTMILSDGATLTDSGEFQPGFGLTQNLLKLTGGSKLVANAMRLHSWGNTGSKLDVGEGCEARITGALQLETNGTAGNYGGHSVDIHGDGALVNVGGDLKMASGVTDCGTTVRDNAALEVGGVVRIFTANDWLDVLNGATATVNSVELTKTNGRLCISNATFTSTKSIKVATETTKNVEVHDNLIDICGEDTVLSIPKIEVGYSVGKSDRNSVVVRDGADVTIPDVYVSSCCNRLTVSNATFNSTAIFLLGASGGATGNVVTVTGPQAVFKRTSNVFGSGNWNRFELADGATWIIGGKSFGFMDGTSNNVLRVTGGATLSNNADPAGDNNFYLYGKDNMLEILDGGTVDVERFFLMGERTRIVVSNGTLRAWSSKGYGIWARGSGGHTIVVQGRTPSVQFNEYKPMTGTEIRFEVPASGYAEGYVPVTARQLNPGSTTTEKFKIECTEWAANHNATANLVLMRCTNDITAAQAAWIVAQNPDLPSNVRLKVRGGDVMLYKRPGAALFVK